MQIQYILMLFIQVHPEIVRFHHCLSWNCYIYSASNIRYLELYSPHQLLQEYPCICSWSSIVDWGTRTKSKTKSRTKSQNIISRTFLPNVFFNPKVKYGIFLSTFFQMFFPDVFSTNVISVKNLKPKNNCFHFFYQNNLFQNMVSVLGSDVILI